MTRADLQAIRADMVGTLRSAARGYEQLAVGRMDIWTNCHRYAADLRAQARELELSGQPPLPAVVSNASAGPETGDALSTRHECASSPTGIRKPFASAPAGCAQTNHVAGTFLKEAA